MTTIIIHVSEDDNFVKNRSHLLNSGRFSNNSHNISELLLQYYVFLLFSSQIFLKKIVNSLTDKDHLGINFTQGFTQL